MTDTGTKVRDRVWLLLVGGVILGVGSKLAFDRGEQQESAAEFTNTLAGSSAEVGMQSWTIAGFVLLGVAALMLLAALIGWVTDRGEG